MEKTLVGFLLVVTMLAFGSLAQANLIGPFHPEDPDNPGTYFNNDTEENMEALLFAETSHLKDLHLLNKWEVSGSNVTDGSWTSMYFTDYLTVEEHPSGNQYAYIGWDLRSFEDLELGAVAVKDGNANGSGVSWIWYYPDGDQEFWNGDFLAAADTLYNGAGAISHISFYGTGDNAVVPEPGTLLLLGAGLSGLGAFRRKLKK